jgi:hypothetical protein
MRVGIAHHLGWAVAVTASADHVVVDRRRIELMEHGLPVAPIEHEAGPLGNAAAATMVAEVRASASWPGHRAGGSAQAFISQNRRAGARNCAEDSTGDSPART